MAAGLFLSQRPCGEQQAQQREVRDPEALALSYLSGSEEVDTAAVLQILSKGLFRFG